MQKKQSDHYDADDNADADGKDNNEDVIIMTTITCVMEISMYK